MVSRQSRLSRRDWLKTASVLAGGAAVTAAAAPVRYPRPDVVTLDPSFRGFVFNTPIERLFSSSSMYWAEGPAWSGWGNYLVWSDIPNNRQYRWLQETGGVSTYRHDSNYSNGNTFDREGRQISFEHRTHRVVRYEIDGTVTVLADSYNGKPLNAPNDGVVDPEGHLWFTDPGYGRLGDYEGEFSDTGSVEPHQKEAIYRLDGQTGRLDQVADDIYKPNGLCFSPGYSTVYVADTGASHYPDAERVIRMWDVDGARLKNGRVFASMPLVVDGELRNGSADGIRCDSDGNVWASAGWGGPGFDGVHVFNSSGERVGLIQLPETCANVCFGGPRRNRLFMTASQSLYAIYTNTRGAHFC